MNHEMQGTASSIGAEQCLYNHHRDDRRFETQILTMKHSFSVRIKSGFTVYVECLFRYVFCWLTGDLGCNSGAVRTVIGQLGF